MAMTMRMAEVRKKPCCMSSQVKGGQLELALNPTTSSYACQLQPNINDSKSKITKKYPGIKTLTMPSR